MPFFVTHLCRYHKALKLAAEGKAQFLKVKAELEASWGQTISDVLIQKVGQSVHSAAEGMVVKLLLSRGVSSLSCSSMYAGLIDSIHTIPHIHTTHSHNHIDYMYILTSYTPFTNINTHPTHTCIVLPSVLRSGTSMSTPLIATPPLHTGQLKRQASRLSLAAEYMRINTLVKDLLWVGEFLARGSEVDRLLAGDELAAVDASLRKLHPKLPGLQSK